MDMPARFRTIDRDTPMLLPADLRDWVPANHVVHFILDAVAALPLASFHVNWRGSGTEQYPPAMMLALLIYCYATGRSSSRQIEAATYSDVAVRYLCANTHPDHSVICAFRTQNRAAFKAAFTAVLQMAREVRLEQVGTVSVDGSKVLANASKHAAVSYARAGQMIEELELEVEQLLKKAEVADATPLRDGLSVPEEIARRQQRQEALRAAEQAGYEAKRAARAERRARGERVRGPEPKPPSAEPEPADQYNFTDPASAIMKAGSGQHFEQAYNAQVAVDARMLIVGERVSDAPNDKRELPATVAAIEPAEQQRLRAVLTDNGFYSEAAVEAVEHTGSGEPSGVTVYAAVEKTGYHRRVADLEAKADPPPPPPGASRTDVMRHRLGCAAGRALYGLRKQTVEPVIGIIKEVMGFRRFRLRGLAKVSLEWTLVCVSYNFKRLFNLRPAMATA